MFRAFRSWLKDAQGQDLAEYCLITAFLAIVGLGIFVHMSGGIQSIWQSADATLATHSAPSRPASAPSEPAAAPADPAAAPGPVVAAEPAAAPSRPAAGVAAGPSPIN